MSGVIDALASPDAALPALAAADNYVAQAITELLGQRQVASFLQIDGLVRRAVATVDNLARAHAPVGIWPVQPAPGRFTVQGEARCSSRPTKSLATPGATSMTGWWRSLTTCLRHPSRLRRCAYSSPK